MGEVGKNIVGTGHQTNATINYLNYKWTVDIFFSDTEEQVEKGKVSAEGPQVTKTWLM